MDADLRKKRKKKLIFTNLKSGIVKTFKSNISAARYFKVSTTTISAHLNNPKLLLSGYKLRIELEENYRRLKKRPKRLTRSLYCLTNGKVYCSMNEAARELGIKLEVQLTRDSPTKRITRPYQFLDLLTINPKSIGGGIRVRCNETKEVFKTAYELSQSINEMLEIVIEHLQGKIPHLRNKTYKLITKGLKPL